MGDLKQWERQPGEPERTYSQFLLYLECGETRKIADAYRKWWRNRNKHKGAEELERLEPKIMPPSGWYTHSGQWDWVKRAQAYDIWVRQSRIDEEREEEERLRREARANRRNLLNASLGTLAKGLEVMNDILAKHAQAPAQIDLGELMQANMMLVKELRTEYGDDPKSKLEISGPNDGPVVLASIDQIREERWRMAAEAMAQALNPALPVPDDKKQTEGNEPRMNTNTHEAGESDLEDAGSE